MYDITKEELVEALINTNCNTTPGIDGITKYDIIQLTDDEKNKAHLIELLNKELKIGIANSVKSSFIIPIHKKK